MTYQKAYDNIVKTIRGVEFLTDEVTLEKALEALYKQIPKKPNITLHDTTDYNTKCTCPTCKKFIFYNPKYCSNCGQALDWTDESEGE